MDQLALLFIVLGIAVAVLLSWGLGVVLLIVGLVLLVWPRARGRGVR